jgi:hypothetical protein
VRDSEGSDTQRTALEALRAAAGLEFRARARHSPLAAFVGANHRPKTELERISVAELNRYRNISVHTRLSRLSACTFVLLTSYEPKKEKK